MRSVTEPLSVKQANETFSVGLFQKQYAITWLLSTFRPVVEGGPVGFQKPESVLESSHRPV